MAIANWCDQSSLPLSPSSRLPSPQTSLRSRPQPAQKAACASDNSDSTPPPAAATCRNCGGPTCGPSSPIRSPPTASSAKASDRLVHLFAIDLDGNKQEVLGLTGQILLQALANASLIDPASYCLEEIDACSAESEVHIAREWLEKTLVTSPHSTNPSDPIDSLLNSPDPVVPTIKPTLCSTSSPSLNLFSSIASICGQFYSQIASPFHFLPLYKSETLSSIQFNSVDYTC